MTPRKVTLAEKALVGFFWILGPALVLFNFLTKQIYGNAWIGDALLAFPIAWSVILWHGRWKLVVVAVDVLIMVFFVGAFFLRSHADHYYTLAAWFADYSPLIFCLPILAVLAILWGATSKKS